MRRTVLVVTAPARLELKNLRREHREAIAETAGSSFCCPVALCGHARPHVSHVRALQVYGSAACSSCCWVRQPSPAVTTQLTPSGVVKMIVQV